MRLLTPFDRGNAAALLLHEHIGKGGKPQPQLIALKLMSGSAVAEQIQLMLLDAVFHFPYRTVVVLMEFA